MWKKKSFNSQNNQSSALHKRFQHKQRIPANLDRFEAETWLDVSSAYTWQMFGYIVCYSTSRCDLHNLIIIFFFCVMVVYFLISMTRQLYDHTRCMLTPGLNKDFLSFFEWVNSTCTGVGRVLPLEGAVAGCTLRSRLFLWIE